jgi:hypothetical protein
MQCQEFILLISGLFVALFAVTDGRPSAFFSLVPAAWREIIKWNQRPLQYTNNKSSYFPSFVRDIVETSPGYLTSPQTSLFKKDF